MHKTPNSHLQHGQDVVRLEETLHLLLLVEAVQERLQGQQQEGVRAAA